MVSISVRVVENKTVLLKWIFFDIEPYVFLTYTDLLKKVSEENDICKGVHLHFATALSTFSCVEEIRGESNVYVIDINKSFGMRFFTLYVTQHEGECACQKPADKEPAQRNAFDVKCLYIVGNICQELIPMQYTTHSVKTVKKIK